MDAIRSLYGTSRSSEIDDVIQNVVENKPTTDPAKDKKTQQDLDDASVLIGVPHFAGMVEYIWGKMLKRKETSNLKHRFVIGNQVLPFPPNIYFEVSTMYWLLEIIMYYST